MGTPAAAIRLRAATVSSICSMVSGAGPIQRRACIDDCSGKVRGLGQQTVAGTDGVDARVSLSRNDFGHIEVGRGQGTRTEADGPVGLCDEVAVGSA